MAISSISIQLAIYGPWMTNLEVFPNLLTQRRGWDSSGLAVKSADDRRAPGRRKLASDPARESRNWSSEGHYQLRVLQSQPLIVPSVGLNFGQGRRDKLIGR